MLSGRITGFAIVATLFVSVVGVGAYAIVRLAPVPEYTAPPKGTFLQDPGPDREMSHPSPPQNEGLTAVEPPEGASTRRNRRAATASLPEKQTDAVKEEMELDRGVVHPPPGQQQAPPQKQARVSAALSVPQSPPHPNSLQPPAAPTPRQHERRLADILTPSEIRRLKRSLRLTPDQEPHWPQVEAVLAEIGAEQMKLARLGQNTADAFSAATSMRIYWAAKPLLATMREDQKAQIRVRARSMGLESVASYL